MDPGSLQCRFACCYLPDAVFCWHTPWAGFPGTVGCAGSRALRLNQWPRCLTWKCDGAQTSAAFAVFAVSKDDFGQCCCSTTGRQDKKRGIGVRCHRPPALVNRRMPGRSRPNRSSTSPSLRSLTLAPTPLSARRSTWRRRSSRATATARPSTGAVAGLRISGLSFPDASVEKKPFIALGVSFSVGA